MNVKEIVKWLKAHNGEIAASAGMLAIGAVVLAIAQKGVALMLVKSSFQGSVHDPSIPEMGIDGEIVQLWNATKKNGKPVIRGIVNNVAVADLGRFGEVLTKIEGVSADAMTDIIIGVAKKG